MIAILLSFHIVICAFLVFVVLLQRSEGGGLGIGSSGGIGDFMSSRGTANFLTKSTTVLATCFFLSSIGLAILANKTYNKESIIDSSDDGISSYVLHHVLGNCPRLINSNEDSLTHICITGFIMILYVILFLILL